MPGAQPGRWAYWHNRELWAANAFLRMLDAYQQVNDQRYRDWAIAGLRRRFHHVGGLLSNHRWARQHKARSTYYMQNLPSGPVQAYRHDLNRRLRWAPLSSGGSSQDSSQ